MVSLKSTTFVFFLVFISISLNTSLAYTNQVTSGSSLRRMEHKETLNGGDEVAKGKMEGRKMMVERRDMKKEEDDEGESLTTAAAATSSNGNSSEYSVGNISHKGQGKMMRMQRKLRIRSTTDWNKDNPGGFMAFNADYHVARSHPPKNN